MKNGPVRLNQLRRSIPDISQKVLVQNLKEMEKSGLIVRKDRSSNVRHVEYSLSELFEAGIRDVLAVITEWSELYGRLKDD